MTCGAGEVAYLVGAALPEKAPALRMTLQADRVSLRDRVCGRGSESYVKGRVGGILDMPAAWAMAGLASVLLKFSAGYCGAQDFAMEGVLHLLMLLRMALQALLPSHIAGIFDGWWIDGGSVDCRGPAAGTIQKYPTHGKTTNQAHRKPNGWRGAAVCLYYWLVPHLTLR
jgi:hypothetical protein